MLKRIFMNFVLVLLVTLCSNLNVLAQDFKVDGIGYDIVSFDDLTCRVVGKYSGDLVIPEKVNYAGRTLTVVGIGSQENSNYLTGITIPNTVNELCENMFKGCKRLARVRIEDGRTALNVGALKDTYTHENGAFADCPVTSLYLGRDCEGWGASLFQCDFTSEYMHKHNKDNLTDVTIGNSVSYIMDDMFANCIHLTNVTIGNYVTRIGERAFSGCNSLAGVVIPNSVTEISDRAFEHCKCLTSIVIPNSVIAMGEYVFYDCIGLMTVELPHSWNSISAFCFMNCENLTSVTIPKNAISIGNCAFYNCKSLTSIVIPNSVIAIGAGAFNGCATLTSLYSLNVTPPDIIMGDAVHSGTFTNSQYMTLNVYVPQEALNIYQNAEVWKNFWNLRGFDATGIENIRNKGVDKNGGYYDCHGIKHGTPVRGVNVVSGKKMFVK